MAMDYTFGTKLIVPKTPAIAKLPSPHFLRGRNGTKINLFVTLILATIKFILFHISIHPM